MTSLRLAALGSAGLLVAAWIVGLSVGGTTVEVADGVLITTEYANAGITQPILVHGVAAVALIALGFALGRLLRSSLVPALASLAGLLSLAQLACEVVLADATADLRQWGAALILLDGVKMLVISALMIVVLALSNRTRSVKFALLPVTFLAAASIAFSGVGYLAMSEVLMLSAYISLPLLLVWAVVAAATAQGRVVRTDDADASK